LEAQMRRVNLSVAIFMVGFLLAASGMNARAADAPASQPVVGRGDIAGTVTDEAGQPLSSALVDVWSWYPGNEIRTDKAGRFVLRKLDSDRPVEIRISKQGFSPWYNEAQPTGVNDLHVALNTKTFFEGTVMDGAGKPVPSALVRADNGPKKNPGVTITHVWTETRTDEKGHYKLFVFPDKYEIQLRVPKVGVARLSETLADQESKPLDIKLEPGITFKATVVDSVSGEPVKDVHLTLDESRGISGTSDKDGQLTINDLLPGPAEFSVRAKGYARWWSEEATSEWQRKKVDDRFQRNFDQLTFNVEKDMQPVKIEVERAVTITGKVEDPDGKAVGGATVAPAASGTGNSITGDTRFSVRTKADGTFEMMLPASNDGQYNLVAHDGTYQQWRNWANGVLDPIQTKPGDQLKDVVLKLTKPATVKGKVVDASGNAVANRQVRAQPADKLENRYYDPTTRTDQDGNFTLKFVRPCDNQIQVAPFWLDVGQAPKGASVQMTLEPGEIKEGVELVAAPER
jgi:protocatechuate 3,4-dioxygenase beta subunit